MKIKSFLVLSCFIGMQSYAQTIQDVVKKTNNELYAQADKDLRDLITKDAGNSLNYYYLAENFFAKDEIDSAVYYYKIAAKGKVEKDAKTVMSFIASGKASWLAKDESAAKLVFASALTLTKNKDAEVMRQIAKVYIYAPNKNLTDVIPLLETAIKLEPNNEDGHLLMGDALLAKTPDNANFAIKSYNKLLDINPKEVRGIVRVGKLYARVNNDSLANVYYKDAQKIDPTFAPAYRENAELFLNNNKASKAIEMWKKYLELNNTLEARYRFATSLYAGKQYCDAITELEYLKAKNYNNFYIERLLAYSYAECSTDKEAALKGLAASDAYFQIVPKDKIFYMDYKYRGLLYSNSGNDSLALIELEKAAGFDEKVKIELAGQIAKLYLKRKDYTKAIEYYEFKYSKSSLTATETFDLGRAYFVGPKNFALADTAFRKLNVAAPTFTSGYFWRARVAVQLDPKKLTWSAKPYYEKTLELIKPEDRATGNNKSMAMESAKYLGDYYVNSPEKDAAKATEYWNIVYSIDPKDPQAKAYLKK